MLILTNCLSEVVDEGCLKIANSLTKRLCKDHDVYTITYDRKNSLSDIHISINKLMLSNSLKKILKSHDDNVMYIPFPAKAISTAVRVFMLSLICPKKLGVVLTQTASVGKIAKLLLRLSRAQLIVLSNSTYTFYKNSGFKKVSYIKAGVDPKRFLPVSKEEQTTLKTKYGFDSKRPVVLHVGHLNYGRNVHKLTQVDEKYQVVLVCSTLTKSEQDQDLRAQLESRNNIRIIDDYLPDIEKIYQLCDVYFFPTQQQGNCIDIPLSCMEAAACDKPVVTTDFGEMQEFRGKDGFYFIDNFDRTSVNNAIEKALCDKSSTRNAILSYDFDVAIDILKSML